jgi:tetratricopeptide (TPR) repeat protein
LGQIHGRIGEVNLDGKQFEQAREYYQKAEEAFSTPGAKGQLAEPVRLAETHEWHGILDLMWGGNFLAQIGAASEEIAEHLVQADQYFEKAIQGYETADRKLEQAIALERWARVQCDRTAYTLTAPEEKRKQIELAQDKLSKAESIALEQAPEIELKPLGKDTSLQLADTMHPEYRLALGKIERLRGRLAFDQVREAQSDEAWQKLLQEAARHFVLACVYSQQFSEEAGELQSALKLVGDRIRWLKYDEIEFFLNCVLAVQKEYGLVGYTSLPERIKLVASIEM